MRRAAKILVVDDQPLNRKLFRALLEPKGYAVTCVASGTEALAAAKSDVPDLVLLDLMMPGMDGSEVACALKIDPVTSSVPIIMVSAHDDRDARLRGLQAGAEDFLTKPIDQGELWLRVRNLLRLKELSDQLRQQSAELEQQVATRTADLQRAASHDALTGLPNRVLFYDTLSSVLATAATTSQSVAVLFIDLDQFKTVNDTLGHGIGDLLLTMVSERLLRCTRVRDTVGRLGGDEFGLILLLDEGQKSAAAVATTLQEALRTPFELCGFEVTVAASIGITLYPDDAQDPDTLIKYADTAMYRAKKAGRDTFRFFTAQMNTEVVHQQRLDRALRVAMQEQQFVLHYQPQVELSSGQVVGFEGLLRWQRPEHELVSPATFIPALEESGLIVRVGSWVIDEACRQMAVWIRAGLERVHVSVNVSGRQFMEGDLEGDVVRAMDTHGIPPGALELELTESSLMENTDRTIAILNNLRARGVHISIDDFGTGYSSLAYLRRFPIDKLKIDVAFVRDITTEPDEAAIALAIIRMAHSLKLDVIAEGVETAAQLNYLRHHRCDQVQGFLLGRPVTPDQAELLLRDSTGVNLPRAAAARDTLLLVDADSDTLRALSEALGDEPYRLLLASGEAEALELLALHPVQVVMSAQQLPSATGPEFLQRVKSLHPTALRIVLTEGMDAVTAQAAINSESLHRCWTRPWDPATLRTDLREAFRQYWRTIDSLQDLPAQRPSRAGSPPVDRVVSWG